MKKDYNKLLNTYEYENTNPELTMRIVFTILIYVRIWFLLGGN